MKKCGEREEKSMCFLVAHQPVVLCAVRAFLTFAQYVGKGLILENT